MATPWYFRNGEQISKPLQPQELKQAVSQGIITATTQVRQGETGAWFTASKVPGLLDPIPPSVGSGTFNAQQIADQALKTGKQYAEVVEKKAGFLDIRFTKFVTPTLITIVWVISVIITCLVIALGIFMPIFAVLATIIANASGVHVVFGINLYACILLFFAGVGSVFYLMLMRIVFEFFIVTFRIEEHLRKE